MFLFLVYILAYSFGEAINTGIVFDGCYIISRANQRFFVGFEEESRRVCAT